MVFDLASCNNFLARCEGLRTALISSISLMRGNQHKHFMVQG